MSNNAFDRNKTKEAKIGQLITEPGEQNQRDAIHIAVVPVIAEEAIKPGAHLDVIHRGVATYATHHGVPVGIADPFLRTIINKGETFWLFLYQGQVTTLRHEWTHPAFPNVTALPVPQSNGPQQEAERRVREFVSQECSWRTYEDFLKDAKEAVSMGWGIQMGDNQDVQAYSGLLNDIGLLTGIDVSDKDGPYFRCAC